MVLFVFLSLLRGKKEKSVALTTDPSVKTY
jgi:hypothetical protein